MPGGVKAENLFNELVDTVADEIHKQKPGSLFEFNDQKKDSISSQFNLLFGRQKSVHHLLGAGKSADVLLWRNKKISTSVLVSATIIWVLFEWLNYHFLTLLCFAVVLVMLGQFLWSNVSGILKSSSENVPRIILPDELFVDSGIYVGTAVNQALGFLQDISCGGNPKQFLMAVAGFWAAAVIGSWCNFLTVIYIGFVAAHTLPVVYERYEDEIDGFISRVLDQLRHHYRRLDDSVLRKIPRGRSNKKYK